MKVFAEVFPYYFTWFLLTLFRIDRNNSVNALIVLIVIVAFFEIQARVKYGTGSFDSFFTNLYTFFPENFTIGENMKLTRHVFPLIYQLLLIICDYTIDAPTKLSDEQEQEKKEIDDRFKMMLIA